MKFFQRKSKCPTCNSELNDKPTRKQKCPHCGNEILIRSGKLLTEDEALILDWLVRLEGFGVTRDIFVQSRDRLTNKFRERANINDTIWSILNQLVGKYGADNAALEQIYRNMSSLVTSEGKDPTPYLLEAEKARQRQINKFKVHSTNLEEFSSALDQILNSDKTSESTSEKENLLIASPNSNNSKNNLTDNNNLEPPRLFLGNDELAFVRGLRSQGKLEKAEEFLRKAEPSPAVLDELRKTASAKAKIAKKNGDWGAVIQHLNSYTDYANKWREHCITTVNQEPPAHSDSDNKLLIEAKKKIAS